MGLNPDLKTIKDVFIPDGNGEMVLTRWWGKMYRLKRPSTWKALIKSKGIDDSIIDTIDEDADSYWEVFDNLLAPDFTIP
eukprot:11389387-Karenia_brevis.AAC.1